MDNKDWYKLTAMVLLLAGGFAALLWLMNGALSLGQFLAVFG